MIDLSILIPSRNEKKKPKRRFSEGNSGDSPERLRAMADYLEKGIK